MDEKILVPGGAGLIVPAWDGLNPHLSGGSFPPATACSICSTRAPPHPTSATCPRVLGETDFQSAWHRTVNSPQNVVWHQAIVTRAQREVLNRHKAVNLWFTGLSGSGKSTLAHAVEERLHALRCRTFVFDGDNVRHGLCHDLGFSPEDRAENIRRIAEMVKLFLEAGTIALTAFISPMRSDREIVRQIIGPENMLEIHCDCPLAICEQRDVKGLYKKARAGLIQNYTGISAPYDPPETPALRLDTGNLSMVESVERIMCMLRKNKIIDYQVAIQ